MYKDISELRHWQSTDIMNACEEARIDTHGGSARQIAEPYIKAAAVALMNHNPEETAQWMLDDHIRWREAIVIFTMLTWGKPFRASKILEGVDGAGKSTAANELHAQLGYPIVHFGRLKGEIEDAFTIYDMFLNIPGIAMDRSFISSIVYHGYDELSRYKEQRLMEKTAERFVTIEYFKLLPKEVMAIRRPDEDYDALEKLDRRYQAIIRRLVEKGINVRMR